MATVAMLWGGASYNNGILPFKHYLLGEAYTDKGEPAAVRRTPVKPTDGDEGARASWRKLYPLPAWETHAAGRHLPRVRARRPRDHRASSPRSACRTHRVAAEARRAGPARHPPVEPRPGHRLAHRGAGASTSPRRASTIRYMWFLGTNDQPGDYRSSGCAGCHVVYANDRDPRHSGPVRRSSATRARRRRRTRRSRKDESGHPLQHALHPRDPVDAVHGLPHAPAEHVRELVLRLHDVGLRVRRAVHVAGEAEVPDRRRDARDPRAQSRGGGDPRQVGRSRVPEGSVRRSIRKLKDTQFADYHGHGWNFRAIFKRDRKGKLLDKDGKAVADDDPRQVQEGGAPVVDPRRRRHAVRRLPLRAGRARQRPHLRRGRRRRSRSTARTATARPTRYPNLLHHRPGGARRAAPTCRCCARRTAASASSGATASSTSARRSIPTRSGR